MPFDQAKTYRFNPFDPTKARPHADYPLHEVGRLTLIRNVTDYHTRMEQAAFEPDKLVAGTGPSPDNMPLARGFSYAPAHQAHLGVNYKQIPVNSPRAEMHSYSKDGAMRVRTVSDPVYAPNSYGGPVSDAAVTDDGNRWYADGETVRVAYTLQAEDGDWGQAETLVREVLDAAARQRLVEKIVGHLLNGVSQAILQKAFEHWRKIDKELGERVEAGVQAKQP
jgi:catalase